MRWAGALALALVGLVPGGLGAQTDVARAEAEGDRRMREFRTADAVEAYRAGLATDPDHPVLLWKAARALSNRAEETPGYEGDLEILEEALGLARRAVEAGPEIARTHSTLAVVLGRYGRALAHVQRIRSARTVIRMAREAHLEARRAIALDPADFAPYTFLGVMNRELATVNPVVRFIAERFLGEYPDVDLDDSLTFLSRAKRLAPEDVTTRVELARTLVELGREAEARDEFRTALALPPAEALDRVEQRRARELLDRLD